MQTNMDELMSKTPLLGDVPVLGWFFKNKTKQKRVNNILVFISPHIVEPKLEGGLSSYSKHKLDDARETLCFGEMENQKRDPIHKWFFKDNVSLQQNKIDAFIEDKITAGDKTSAQFAQAEAESLTAPATPVDLSTHEPVLAKNNIVRTRKQKKKSLFTTFEDESIAQPEEVIT